MIDSIINALTDSNYYLFWVYWVSVVVCIIKSFFNWIYFYKIDLHHYKSGHISSYLTFGTITGDIVVSFLPVLNTLHALYVVTMEWAESFFKFRIIQIFHKHPPTIENNK